MKLLLLTVMIAMLSGLVMFDRVDCQSCGMTPIKPIVPVTCKDLAAFCRCDAQGHCSWTWLCVK